MLALRSSGINLNEMQKLFGNEWLNEEISYLEKLEEGNLLIKESGLIKLTKSGYAVCDEIIKNLMCEAVQNLNQLKPNYIQLAIVFIILMVLFLQRL